MPESIEAPSPVSFKANGVATMLWMTEDLYCLYLYSLSTGVAAYSAVLMLQGC
jgi:hypothetical protein